MSERQHCKCSGCGDVRECVLIGAESDEGWVWSWQCEGCVRGMLDGFGEADTIARLTRERDEARAAYASASREWAERHEHARERILGLTRERNLAVDEINRLMTEATYAENARLTASLAYETDRNVARSADVHAATMERDAWRHRAESAERERDELRLTLRGPAGTMASLLRSAEADRDEARAALARAYGCVTRNKAPDNPHQAAQGIIEEYRDVSNERDQFEEQAIQSRRWSRLWHREARRLWREVQALGAMLDDVQREVDAEQFIRNLEGDQ